VRNVMEFIQMVREASATAQPTRVTDSRWIAILTTAKNLVKLEPLVTERQRIGSSVVANDLARAGETVLIRHDAV